MVDKIWAKVAICEWSHAISVLAVQFQKFECQLCCDLKNDFFGPLTESDILFAYKSTEWTCVCFFQALLELNWWDVRNSQSPINVMRDGFIAQDKWCVNKKINWSIDWSSIKSYQIKLNKIEAEIIRIEVIASLWKMRRDKINAKRKVCEVDRKRKFNCIIFSSIFRFTITYFTLTCVPPRTHTQHMNGETN